MATDRTLKLALAASDVVTIGDAKRHSRIIESAEDATVIPDLIDAATQFCEQCAGRAFGTQHWTLRLPGWPGGRTIRLPKPPLQSVTSVKYFDEAGVEQTLDSADYTVRLDEHQAGRIELDAAKTWPSLEVDNALPVEVVFVCGYAAIPPAIKTAVLITFDELWRNRGQSLEGTIRTSTSITVQSLLNSVGCGQYAGEL